MAANTPLKGTAAAAYIAGATDREPYLRRARRIARLTVTWLFPEEGATGQSDEVLPWQSAGAFMVNSFAAKQTLALFPPGVSFYRLTMDRKALASLEELEEAERAELKGLIERGLAKVEREAVAASEEDGDRAVLYEAKLHMVVGGNHCIKVDPDDGTLSGYALDRYVTWRNRKGKLREFVIEDSLGWADLPDDVKDLCRGKGYQEDPQKKASRGQDDILLYTHGQFRDGKWHVYQECWGEEVPGTKHTWDEDKLPFLFLGEIFKSGEHYARSYCEAYEEDFQTLDAFWQILTEGGAAAALLKWLVAAGGTTNKEQFAKLPNGGVMTGNVNEVGAVRADKGGDLNVAANQAAQVEQRLSRVFLLYSSIQRKGERVTAEEIATLRRDLEDTQGGVFANLTPHFQRPYAETKLRILQKQKRVTPLPQGSVKLTVLTGDLGLGRSAQASNEDQFLGTFQALFPQAFQEYVSPTIYAIRAGANKGVDTEGLILSEEAVAQARQAQQQLDMVGKLGPSVIDQGGAMLQNQQTQAAEAAQQEA